MNTAHYTQQADSLGAALTAMLIGHVDSHAAATNAGHWPDDAVYCVEYRLKAWPTDFSKHTRFFSDAYALTKWYDGYVEWSRSEDNYFELDRMFIWDLGPVPVTDFTVHINAR